MGSAMLRGWLADTSLAAEFAIVEPFQDHLGWTADHANIQLFETVESCAAAGEAARMMVLAVKPQMMEDAIAGLGALAGPETGFLSIAAGIPTSWFRSRLGDKAAILRSMPNTPAAIGQGITALIGNAVSTADHINLAHALLSAIGAVVDLDSESQMDAVTGVSGSGPAYVFYMIDALAKAGEAQGLSPDLAMQLAKATVAGAGALAKASEETPEQLRINVTSPNGTTQAGLEVLMDQNEGLTPLIGGTVAAATMRSKELSNG